MKAHLEKSNVVVLIKLSFRSLNYRLFMEQQIYLVSLEKKKDRSRCVCIFSYILHVDISDTAGQPKRPSKKKLFNGAISFRTTRPIGFMFLSLFFFFK